MSKTEEIPAIVDEAKKAGCENDQQIIGYLAAEISRIRAMQAKDGKPVTPAQAKADIERGGHGVDEWI